MQKYKNKDFYIGVTLIFLLTLLSKFISEFDFFHNLGLSLLIISILIGMIITNILRVKIAKKFEEVIEFCTKELLRLAIIFYGFRLTFNEILDIGINGIFVSIFIVTSTFIIGYFIGTRILKLDKEITILTSAGSAICGAAAILASEGTLKNKAYKSTIAISTVVLFGTLAMFLYPYIIKTGLLSFNNEQISLYIGGTLHEVAHVVGAANSFENEAIAHNSVVVKMLRVMLLAPFLIIISLFLINKNENQKSNITIPWFAVFFILVAIFNSFDFFPKHTILVINQIDTFLLSMAMMSLGLKTNFQAIKQSGFKPLFLALILFFWLLISGFFIIKYLYP